MPLVRLFVQKTLTKAVPLPALQASLCGIWGTTPKTTKLLLSTVDAWTDEFGEDVYVSVRLKGTPERTRAAVLEKCEAARDAFAAEGLVANLRLETYVGESFFHVPPPSSSS